MKAKCIVVLAALVIALGGVMMITGCCQKKCTKAPETKAVEKAPTPAPAAAPAKK